MTSRQSNGTSTSRSVRLGTRANATKLILFEMTRSRKRIRFNRGGENCDARGGRCGGCHEDADEGVEAVRVEFVEHEICQRR